jgi:hypothetical protein
MITLEEMRAHARLDLARAVRMLNVPEWMPDPLFCVSMNLGLS